MPIQNGLELAKEIKELKSKKPINVILATDIKIQGTQGIIDMIVEKPLNSEIIYKI